MDQEKLKKIEEKIESGRQYRSMTMEVRDQQPESEKVVRGYATTFDEEYVLFKYPDYEFREKVDAHAFDQCDMSDVIMQYDHQGRVFARTNNKTLALETDAHGLLITADLSGTEIGRQLYEEIRGGYTTKMSFGFHVQEDKREIIEDRDTGKYTVIRTITKIDKLYDVSAVSLPANDGTEISARNWCDGVIAEVEAERLKEAERRKTIMKLELKMKLGGII